MSGSETSMVDAQWLVLPPVVHQAAGMISVVLGESVGSGYAWLDAYAVRSARSVSDVAQDVVDRQVSIVG